MLLVLVFLTLKPLVPRLRSYPEYILLHFEYYFWTHREVFQYLDIICLEGKKIYLSTIPNPKRSFPRKNPTTKTPRKNQLLCKKTNQLLPEVTSQLDDLYLEIGDNSNSRRRSQTSAPTANRIIVSDRSFKINSPSELSG
jgi:hypothetical protein